MIRRRLGALGKENCKSEGFAFCFALALHYLSIK